MSGRKSNPAVVYRRDSLHAKSDRRFVFGTICKHKNEKGIDVNFNVNVWHGSSQGRPPRYRLTDSNEASTNASINFSVKCSALDAAEEAESADRADSFEKFGSAGTDV